MPHSFELESLGSEKGNGSLRPWHTALPSWLEITMTGDMAMDVERARAIHVLLGKHADVVEIKPARPPLMHGHLMKQLVSEHKHKRRAPRAADEEAHAFGTAEPPESQHRGYAPHETQKRRTPRDKPPP